MMIDQERKFEDESIRIFIDTLLLIRIYFVLFGTFWNFINTVMRLDYHDYIGDVWNPFENIQDVWCKNIFYTD